MTLGKVTLRAVIGPLMFAHGAQKLFGWFGGPGVDGTAGFFEKLGLRPGRRLAEAAGIGETTGGALLTLGFLTPLASALITGSMVTAIRKVHAEKGLWNTKGGFEYNALILAVGFLLADDGPGRPSLDELALPRLKGPGWGLLQLAAGIAGSYAATEACSEPASEQPVTEARTGGEPGATRRDGDRATVTAGVTSS